MTTCDCAETHSSKRIALTGGPGAGKTTTLDLIRRSFCGHVKILPESASVIFGGGFPRGGSDLTIQAAQRAIYYVQRELENAALLENPAIILCDRGTLDGAAYWRGSPDLWSSVGTSLEEQLDRYHAVIHLGTPSADSGYNQDNPLRIESAIDALEIDAKIAAIWASHPRKFTIGATGDFLAKATQVVALVEEYLPPCCRPRTLPPAA